MRASVMALTACLLMAIAVAAQQAGAQDLGRAVHGSDRVELCRTTTIVIPQPYYYRVPYSYYYGPYRPYYPGGYGYYPRYVAPYSYYGPRYIYPPPVAIPAESLYGPRAVRRFMGWP